MSKISVTNYFPSVLVVDHEDIAVKVRRLTNKQFDDFAVAFEAYASTRPVDVPLTATEKAAQEDETRAWIVRTLDAYFVIDPDQIDDEGRDITRGGELLDLFGGRSDVVPQALALIYGENKVNGKKKERFRSQLDSSLGLRPEPQRTGNGAAPDSTAPSAAPSSSVSLAGVMAASSDASCGTTAP